MEHDFVDWWASLKHGGLLIAPSRLIEHFSTHPDPLPWHLAERLRRDVTRLEAGTPEAERGLIDTVLEGICGLDGSWKRGADVEAKWSHRALTGEVVKPRRTWHGSNGAFLPIFVDVETRLGVGRGKRSVARIVEWLRKLNQHLALVTNARQWRLIYAGLNHEAWAEWDVELWFQEGQPGPQVAALRALLTPQALTPSKEGDPCPLLGAILDTRRGQAELSSELGERVRRAVELLIQSHGPQIHKLGPEVNPRDIYLAATRVIMRMVVILFAEARDLLPRSLPMYHQSYGLQGLREMLERVGGGGASERLRDRASAWPRILGLFRLVHQGSPHERLPIVRYGGGMFAAGETAGADPVGRALAVFENPEHSPSDAIVYEILHLLCRSRVKVRQGKGATWIEVPVDFSDLSSEYIGILYEGLLDFELRQVTGTDPVIFLAIGDEPALPLSRLESMDEPSLSALVEKMKAKRTQATEEEEAEAEDEDVPENSMEAEEAETPPVEPAGEHLDDAHFKARERAQAWARKAVLAGKLVAKPRSKKAEVLREHEIAVEIKASTLVGRVVLPGEWFLVQWGGTRKGAGTFYTRPGLAIPTAQRTLRPLAYTPPARGGKPDEDAPASEWSPRKPEEILALKVCDPAVGSGSFLIAALRFLTDALFASLHHHSRIKAQANGSMITLAEGKPTQGLLVEDPLPSRPDSDEFEPALRARLKRYVVERCLYGVDMDPLAVELAKLALWVETMDRSLPFEFLEDKLKAGNSLVGCWFDRFRDYPVLAWEREGGDKGHSNGVHFGKEARTKAIAQFRSKTLKSALRTWLEEMGPQKQFDFVLEGKAPETIHDEIVALFEEMNRIPIHEPDRRAEFYRTKIATNPELRRLKAAFDTWCAIWFWPTDELAIAPLPAGLLQPSPEAEEVVSKSKGSHRFFHWELEFPDVFAKVGGGFDAILGNPPWEIQKPSSKEFFSNIDPLYRAYGKQEAIQKQSDLFRASAEIEAAWLDYNAGFRALSNWIKQTASPFGDPQSEVEGESLKLGRAYEPLLEMWKSKRKLRAGYADPEHPYRHQGSADLNTYKLFLEHARALLRDGGILGFIVPSGIYTDKGTTDLRTLLLTRSRWRWVFGFINWNKIFQAVYYRFKFTILIVEKGGATQRISSCFLRYHLHEWEEAEQHLIPYSREQVEKFSPRTRALLEIRHQRDLEIVETIYGNSVLLGDDGPDGWGIKYATEFHMTNDSKLFPPRPHWEAKGYRPDEYGRWIKPKKVVPLAGHEREIGWIKLADGSGAVHENEIEDIALPVYEGRMIDQYDFAKKGWVSGKGRGAKWNETEWGAKRIEPQYLMARDLFRAESDAEGVLKVGMMDVTSATNARTVIATCLRGFPCGHKVPTLTVAKTARESILALVAIMNSLAFDYVIRSRLGGNSLTWAVLGEAALLRLPTTHTQFLASMCAKLALAHPMFSPEWLLLRNMDQLAYGSLRITPWRRAWAITPRERLRLRCAIDAIVFSLFNLKPSDVTWILRGCDYSVAQLRDPATYRTLDPKGFWRANKDLEPEHRQTVLALSAFLDLEDYIRQAGGNRDGGLHAWCLQNGGEGWDLPLELDLEEVGFRPESSKRGRIPVQRTFGERQLPWQLVDTVEESWDECARHARNLLGPQSYDQLQAKVKGLFLAPPQGAKPATTKEGQGLLFGQARGTAEKQNKE